MTRPYHPVFPEGGWHCVKCSRPFGYFIQTCPYCLVDRPRSTPPVTQRKPLPLQLKHRTPTAR